MYNTQDQMEKLPAHLTDACRYREEAFSRNIGFWTVAEQERLHGATVALPGLGGVGGAHLTTLARAGIGCFHLADFDRFETANINRQYGARADTVGRGKLAVMVEEARRINPFIELRTFGEGVTPDNIDAFLHGVDVLVDSIDFFNLNIRRALFNRARQLGIHTVTAGPAGFGSALLVFAPDCGMSFDRYFDIDDSMSMEDKLIAFLTGLVPKAAHKRYLLPGSINMSERRGPSLAAGCQLCAAAAAAEVIRIILKKPGLRPAPCYAQYDPFAQRFYQGRLWFGNRGPLQRLKRRFLKARIGAGDGYLAEPKPKSPDLCDPTQAQLPDGLCEYLLQAAVRAPSGDNCQPWRFSVRGRTIRIGLNASADESFFNVSQAASLISCGAAAENLAIAATRFGLRARMDVATQAARPAVDITLDNACSTEDPLQRFVWERHTNRTRYDGKPLDPSELRSIRSVAGSYDGATLILLSDPQHIREAARLVYRADLIRSTHRGLHEHLMRMIRFTTREALEKRDGFALKNLEAGALGEWVLRRTRSWPAMAVLNKVGLDKMISMVSWQGMRSASAIGMLKVNGRGPADLIKGGRALERVWLTATRLGLDFQPMTAITLFWMRWQMDGSSHFSPAHRQLLSRLWPAYERLFDVQSRAEGHVMLFRIGRGRPVACRTLRKPLSCFADPVDTPAASLSSGHAQAHVAFDAVSHHPA